MRLHCPLILASRSPRRRTLLQQLGLHFKVKVSHIDESVSETMPPASLVKTLALRKARSVAPKHPDALTLAADTIVVLDDAVLGKPADDTEAAATLHTLSGRTHTVYTGIALIHAASGREQATLETTRVTFAPLTDREIKAYVRTGSPLDKAGAYGIQDDFGAVFVQRIDGDYYNVVGLPLHRLYGLLNEHFAEFIEL